MPSYRPEADRFWEKVEIYGPDECWLWTAGKFGRKGEEYGCFWLTGGRKQIGAHIWSYVQAKGDYPLGYVIHHICEVRLCVNPDHLEPKTQRENILLGNGVAAQDARKVVCKWGHSLEDAFIIGKGRRDCRTCRKLRASRRTTEYRRVHG